MNEYMRLKIEIKNESIVSFIINTYQTNSLLIMYHTILTSVLFVIVAVLWALCSIATNPDFMLASLLNKGVCESVIETTNMVETRMYYRCYSTLNDDMNGFSNTLP